MLSMIPILPDGKEDFLRMAVSHFSELDRAFVPQQDWKERYFQIIDSNPDYFLRWIVCDGTRTGFILFGVENHRFLPRKSGAIYELYIRPEFRRRGIAKECALAAIRELWTYSPSKIQLEVVDGNTAAAALWNSLGFRKVTERYVLRRSEP